MSDISDATKDSFHRKILEKEKNMRKKKMKENK